MQSPAPPVRAQYEQCSLGDLHKGQMMNLVCREDCCCNKLICLICQYEKHQDHNITLARRFIAENVPAFTTFAGKFDLESLSALVSKHEKQTIDSIEEIRTAFTSSLDSITNELKRQCQELLESYKLVKEVSVAESQRISTELLEKITRAQSFVRVELETQLHISEKAFSKNKGKILQEIDSWSEIFKKKRSASWLAHPKIQITEMKLRSTGNPSFKYALLDWGLGNEKKAMRYKILKDTNNWVAIGVAHRNIVETKNFVFSSSVGHGAFMVSSNGNSWSNIREQFNNTIKSFKFLKGDIIVVVYDPLQKKIRFKKENSRNPKDQYELDITIAEPNDLCFGAVFYYESDELELVPVTASTII